MTTTQIDNCKYVFNDRVKQVPDWSGPDYSFLESVDMAAFHRSIDGYAPTPLLSLPATAARLGLKEIYVKDESHRFGIKAFKALGASYAIFRFLQSRWREKFGDTVGFGPDSFKDSSLLAKLGAFTFCGATDGNHGRAVAWTAKKLKQRAVIYMPDNTAQSRIDNIKQENAEVVLVPGSFDDCVARCAADAERNGWQAISDTAYPGYMDIPRFIMLGYTGMFKEIEIDGKLNGHDNSGLDYVFLPAGVGGVAAAGTSYYVRRYGAERPKLICVEPSDCDCFLQSVKRGDGSPVSVGGDYKSVMVGLNCGIPSPVAWPIIRDGVHLFTAITDAYAFAAMRAYHKEGIVSGESGSAGLAGLIALQTDAALLPAARQIGLGKNSRILLINTEGDTDPINYKRIIAGESG